MRQEQIIAGAIDYLVAHYQDHPSLEALAARAGYDPAHFQKIFREHVGISPKRLCQYMAMRHARELLERGAGTLDAAFDAGLSGNGRLYDLFVACEGVSPGGVQSRGRGLDIVYGFQPSVTGEVMVAKTPLGVCWLGFMVDERRDETLRRARMHWPEARFTHDDDAIEEEAAHIMRIWHGQGDEKRKLRLDLHGTNFQIQVWQALLRIPAGETRTYLEIAQEVGLPKASRAVGNAVGANPVSLLIPCHRVIRATGIIDNYGWGSPRKKLLLAMEGTQASGF